MPRMIINHVMGDVSLPRLVALELKSRLARSPVGVLLYDGDEILSLTNHTLALPLTVALFGTPA